MGDGTNLRPGSGEAENRSSLHKWTKTEFQQRTTSPTLIPSNLSDYLSEHGIDISGWGVGAAKRVADLQHELEQSESTLAVEEGRLLRCLRVVKLRMHRPGSSEYLREAKQTMADGRERVSNNEKPGEKMVADEDPLEAAVRGAREELAERFVQPTGMRLLHETIEVKPSASYPTLMCRYTFFEVEMAITGLPDTSFQTTEHDGTKRKVHWWEWHLAMVQQSEDLELSDAQVSLLERLFAGSPRLEVSKLQGGHSGSIVLRTDPYGADGRPEEPTVTKIDLASSLVEEVRETNFVTRLGVDAVRVVRGPIFSEEQSSHVLAYVEAKIDGPLRERLLDGSVAILKCAWLLSDESDAKLDRDEAGNVLLRRRQDMPLEAYFTPKESAALLDRDDRSLFVASYGWQSAKHPDPHGKTLYKMRRYFRNQATVTCGLFCASSGLNSGSKHDMSTHALLSISRS